MLPYNFLALRLKSREGVVQGNSTTTMIRTISTIRHVRTVTTSIKYIID